MPASKAAGEIHTEMERGFVKAVVYTFDDLMKYKYVRYLKIHGK